MHEIKLISKIDFEMATHSVQESNKFYLICPIRFKMSHRNLTQTHLIKKQNTISVAKNYLFGYFYFKIETRLNIK